MRTFNKVYSPLKNHCLGDKLMGLLEFGVMGIANGILTIYTPYV